MRIALCAQAAQLRFSGEAAHLVLAQISGVAFAVHAQLIDAPGNEKRNAVEKCHVVRDEPPAVRQRADRDLVRRCVGRRYADGPGGRCVDTSEPMLSCAASGSASLHTTARAVSALASVLQDTSSASHGVVDAPRATDSSDRRARLSLRPSMIRSTNRSMPRRTSG